MRSAAACALALAAVGCGDRPAHVVVWVDTALVPPFATVEVVALPFDAEALLDSLALAAETPPPAFPELEAELRAFRAPPPADLGEAGRAWTATRDSLARLADSLERVDRRSPGYRSAYARYGALYQRLAQRGAARDAAIQEVRGEIRDLARRAGRAADSLRRWEAAAYASFDSLASATTALDAREVRRGRPDATGRLEVELSAGPWWITMHLPHPGNPFMEYAWHVPAVSRAGLPLAVPLYLGNAALRWRH